MGKIRIRPVAGKILLRVLVEAREKNVGGIIVAGEAARSKFRKAIVEAVHDGYAGELNVGDTVMLPPYGGTEICVSGCPYVFIRPEALAAAFE